MEPKFDDDDNFLNDIALKAMQEAVLKAQRAGVREEYSKVRTEREKATFAMMMRMNPQALTAIRKEFFVRRDEIDINEFIYIIQKHLNNSAGFDGPEQREFGMKMFDLFKDIDVNGDGNLEWQEFTTYVVEKANLLNKRLKSTSIPHYYDSSENLDSSAQYRHRHDISKFVNMPTLNQFAMVEDHKNSVFVFNTRLGKHIGTVTTESAPVCLEYVSDKDLLVCSCADMTLSTYSMADPNHNRRYRQRSAWSTPGVQMALAYMPANHLLYSGGTNGNLYSWKIAERSLVSTFSGHTDIVMALTVLQKLNNVASGSLDKTVNVWDSYTNSRVLELHGHKKGVLDMTYNPEYRLLFSCGFEHDACVWSPFVNSLVYRFRGHHASLIGIHAVEGTPEVLTADIQGVFKLWDIRNYNCVQTFTTNLTGSDTKDSSKLSCFFQTRMPPVNNQQKEDDSRIYAASKMLFSFDQARVVHDATTDFTIVGWVGWNSDASTFITVSSNTVICWNALLGSKTVTNSDICTDEISACCLDDRMRKIIVGDIKGIIGIYNCTNGAKMKNVQDNVHSTVIALQYIHSQKRFIAGYSNGLMRIYDENSLEDCNIVKTFDAFNRHPELLCLAFNEADSTVATVGASSGVALLWDNAVGKSEFELKTCDSTECVVTLAYLTPFPLVAISDSRGNVCVWGSRGCKWAGKRVCAFMNQTPSDAQYEKLVRPNAEEDDKPRRVLSALDWESCSISYDVLDEDLPGDQFDAISEAEEISVNSSKQTADMEEEQASVALSTDTEPDVAAAIAYFDESEATWGRAMAASCIAFDPQSYRLFTADDLGHVRCYSLRYMMHDIGGNALRDHSQSRCRLKDQCAHTPRTSRSAPPAIYKRKKRYLVGKLNDSMSFVGVEFCWALAAHDNRIVFTRTTENGLLTSGTDRLVKMWTFDGLPIGVLLQSVPVGMRSQSWDLDIDAEELMKKDEGILDEVIEGVVELSNRSNIPDINVMDLEGIEPGVNAADFSRSDLRQRIELTSEILGIDFPTESERYRRQKIKEEHENLGDLESLASSAKSSEIALRELKSSESAVDYKSKIRGLSLMQKRHRAVKMEVVSEKYADKSGISIAVDMSIYPDNNKKLIITNKGESSTVGRVADHMLGVAPGSVSSSNGLSLHSQKGKPPNRPSTAHSTLDTRKSEVGHAITNRNRSVIKSAIGPRAASLNQRCSQYETFSALDRAMEHITNPFSRPTTSQSFRAELQGDDALTKEMQSHRRETTRIHAFHQVLIEQLVSTKATSRASSANVRTNDTEGNISESISRRTTLRSLGASSQKTRSSSTDLDSIKLERGNSTIRDGDGISVGSKE